MKGSDVVTTYNTVLVLTTNNSPVSYPSAEHVPDGLRGWATHCIFECAQQTNNAERGDDSPEARIRVELGWLGTFLCASPVLGAFISRGSKVVVIFFYLVAHDASWLWGIVGA